MEEYRRARNVKQQTIKCLTITTSSNYNSTSATSEVEAAPATPELAFDE